MKNIFNRDDKSSKLNLIPIEELLYLNLSIDISIEKQNHLNILKFQTYEMLSLDLEELYHISFYPQKEENNKIFYHIFVISNETINKLFSKQKDLILYPMPMVYNSFYNINKTLQTNSTDLFICLRKESIFFVVYENKNFVLFKFLQTSLNDIFNKSNFNTYEDMLQNINSKNNTDLILFQTLFYDIENYIQLAKSNYNFSNIKQIFIHNEKNSLNGLHQLISDIFLCNVQSIQSFNSTYIKNILIDHHTKNKDYHTRNFLHISNNKIFKFNILSVSLIILFLNLSLLIFHFNFIKQSQKDIQNSIDKLYNTNQEISLKLQILKNKNNKLTKKSDNNNKIYQTINTKLDKFKSIIFSIANKKLHTKPNSKLVFNILQTMQPYQLITENIEIDINKTIIKLYTSNQKNINDYSKELSYKLKDTYSLKLTSLIFNNQEYHASMELHR